MNAYIVTFDRQPGKTYKEFHEQFVGHSQIKTWWHYIKSCYIIKTSLTANELSDHFTACAKKCDIATTHLVVKVDLNDKQGMLVKDAWAWIRKNKLG